MEWLGLIALGMVICFSSYPGKVTKLEKQVKKLEKKQKGANVMSKLINELHGKECEITSTECAELVGATKMKCVVLDSDDEWIKVRYTDKKNNEITRLLRIEVIDQVAIME